MECSRTPPKADSQNTRLDNISHTRSAVATDSILSFRACLLRGIHYIPDQLLRRRVHAESRAQRFLRSTDDDEQITIESVCSTRITQFVYMFETVRTKLSDDDPRRAKLLDRLALSIVKQSIDWSTARNQLHARQKQLRWLDVASSSGDSTSDWKHRRG